MNKDVLSTLFVGIDVSSASNYFCAINFEGKHILDFSITNDLLVAKSLLKESLVLLI